MNIDWKLYKENRLLELKGIVDEMEVKPNLAIIQVGHNPASDTYIKNKINACNKLGINHSLLWFDESVSEEQIINTIKTLNEDKSINGLFVQLPIPGIEDASRIVESIDPLKDVDGLTKRNFAALAYKEDTIVPCTPKGVVEMLDHIGIDLDGKDVCIVGRSHLVGLPLMHLFLQRNATITVCHTHTKDLKEKTSKADIIISAAGNHKNLITEDMVKEGSVIIDVAISKDMETGKLYGDCDYENIKEKVLYITPVPGGVGQLTVLELMSNIIEATMLQRKQDNVTLRLK